MASMTDTDHREAGAAIFDYMHELLAHDGDKATVILHADHIRSLDRFIIAQIECPGS